MMLKPCLRYGYNNATCFNIANAPIHDHCGMCVHGSHFEHMELAGLYQLSSWAIRRSCGWDSWSLPSAIRSVGLPRQMLKHFCGSHVRSLHIRCMAWRGCRISPKPCWVEFIAREARRSEGFKTDLSPNTAFNPKP